MADREDRDDVEHRERLSTDDARTEAGAPEGIELPAPDFAHDTGMTDLGVLEPRADQTPHVGERDDVPPGSEPPGP